MGKNDDLRIGTALRTPVNFRPKSYFTFSFLRHVLVRATVKRGDEQHVVRTVSVLKTWLKRSFRLCFRQLGIIIAETLG